MSACFETREEQIEMQIRHVIPCVFSTELILLIIIGRVSSVTIYHAIFSTTCIAIRSSLGYLQE